MRAFFHSTFLHCWEDRHSFHSTDICFVKTNMINGRTSLITAVVLVALNVGIKAMTAAATTAPPPRLCYVSNGDAREAAHFLFASRYYYQNQLASTSAGGQSILIGEPRILAPSTARRSSSAIADLVLLNSPRGAVFAIADAGSNLTSDCAVILGPPTSAMTVAMTPMVEQPVLSHGASSDELSNKDAYFWFSRTIPADSYGTQALAVMTRDRLGLNHVTIIAGDDAYGRSLATGFRRAYEAPGTLAQVDDVFYIPSPNLAATVNVSRAVETALVGAADASVILVAALADVIQLVVSQAKQLGYHKEKLFLFSEAACAPLAGTSSIAALTVPGSLCYSFALDPVAYATYNTAFVGRVTAADELALLTDVAGPYRFTLSGAAAATFATGATTVSEALLVDAVRTAVSALYATSAAVAGGTATPAVLLAAIRRSSLTDGITGPVTFDASGDRVGAIVEVNNVLDNGVIVPWGQLQRNSTIIGNASSSSYSFVPYPNQTVSLIVAATTPATLDVILSRLRTRIFTMCYICQNFFVSTLTAFHSVMAAKYLSDRFSSSVKFRHVLLSVNGNVDAPSIALSIINNRQRCDGFLGPLMSRVAIASSPLIQAPWISETASSTELSDKTAHPFFSRVTPTDDVTAGALAALARQFGVRAVPVVCSDEPYGRSVAASFQRSFASPPSTSSSSQGDGTATVFACLGASADERIVESQLRDASSVSRFMVIAVLIDLPVYQTISRVIRRLGLHVTHAFAYPEAGCTDDDAAPPPGSFCARVSVNRTRAKPYLEFLAAPKNKAMETYQTMIDPASATKLAPFFPGFAPTIFTVECALAYDASYLMMQAIHTAATVTPTLGGSTMTATAPILRFDNATEMVRHLRHTTVDDGITGRLALNPLTGDRLSVTIELLNRGPTGALVTFAAWNDLDGYYGVAESTTMSSSSSPRLYWFNTSYRTDIPNLSIHVPYAPPSWLILLAIGVAAFVGIGVFVLYKIRHVSDSMYDRLIVTNTWAHILALVFQCVDVASDIIGCVSVVQSTVLDEMFTYGYLTVTIVGVCCVVVEMTVLIRHIRVAFSGDLLDLDLITSGEIHIQKTEVLTFILEDIPMVTVGSVALFGDTSIVVVISVLLSALGLGLKSLSVRKLLASTFQARGEDEAIDDVKEVELMHRSDSLVAGGHPNPLLLINATNTTTGEVDSGARTPPQGGGDAVAAAASGDFFVAAVARFLPMRQRALNRKADEVTLELRAMHVTAQEYFAFIAPRLTTFFEGLMMEASIGGGAAMAHPSFAASPSSTTIQHGGHPPLNRPPPARSATMMFRNAIASAALGSGSKLVTTNQPPHALPSIAGSSDANSAPRPAEETELRMISVDDERLNAVSDVPRRPTPEHGQIVGVDDFLNE